MAHAEGGFEYRASGSIEYHTLRLIGAQADRHTLDQGPPVEVDPRVDHGWCPITSTSLVRPSARG